MTGGGGPAPPRLGATPVESRVQSPRARSRRLLRALRLWPRGFSCLSSLLAVAALGLHF